MVIPVFHGFSLPTPPDRISLPFPSGASPFPCCHSARSRWHSNPHIRRVHDPAPSQVHECSWGGYMTEQYKQSTFRDVRECHQQVCLSSPLNMNLRDYAAGLPAAILWPWGDACPSESGASPMTGSWEREKEEPGPSYLNRNLFFA